LALIQDNDTAKWVGMNVKIILERMGGKIETGLNLARLMSSGGHLEIMVISFKVL
jgi:hypothetical protein